MMIVSLHNLAKNYKFLPSEALEKATTFDLYVLDVYGRYMRYLEDKESARQTGKSPSASKKYSQKELQTMIQRAKQFSSDDIK